MPSQYGPGRAVFTVAFGPEWKRVEAELLAQDKSLARKFRVQLAEQSEKLAARARGEVMRIPTHTGQHSGLRSRVARGVGMKITKSGVQITTSMNDSDEVNLPAYLDQQNGWRHPVYGDRHTWVHQSTGGSWFRDTIARGQPEIEDRLTGIFEDTARSIARAGG